ncbi:MAG: PAS domain S-box protein [Balneolaceae bacterium]
MIYKALILEDNEIDASLMEQYLKRSNLNFEVEWVASGEAYEEVIESCNPDVIISDYRLKEYSGLDAIQYRNLNCEDVPLLVVSGTIGEEKAVELIKEGATDFLNKNNAITRLAPAVERAIKEFVEKERRKRAEFDLKKSEKRFRLLFEHSIDGIIIGNPDDNGGIITANDAACKILGYSLAELKKLPLLKLLNSKAASVKKDNRIDKTGSFQGDVKLEKKDGTFLPVEISSRTLELKSGERRSYHIIRDISERVESQRRLEKEKNFIEKALDSLPGIFYMLDHNNNFILINNSFENELGYTQQEIQQMTLLDIYHPDDHERITEKIEEAFYEGKKSTVARLRKKNGTSAYYFLTGTRFNQNGNSYILGSGSDITERIKAEKQLKESLKEKEVLLSEIHHRVKNNLAVISGIMELQANESDDEELRSKLFDSKSRIKSIALTHELLYQEKKFSSIDLSENIRKLVKGISESLYAEIKVQFHLDQVSLNINQALPLSLILNELLTNAYKHAFTGITNPAIEIKLKEENNEIYLSVMDNGIGLSLGTDLKDVKTTGFTLVKILCEQLKCSVKIDSANGTRFHLQFPKTNVKGVGSSFLGSRK